MTGGGGDHGTHSELSGVVDGGVVQARDIAGGIHFHTDEGQQRESPRPRQLPAAVRVFVNHEEELRRLDALCAADGVVAWPVCVVAGTAGVGKTALAIRWAHQAKGYFPDGQLYVNLHGYGPDARLDPHDALRRFLIALDVPAKVVPADVESAAALYRSLMSERRVLVVLDNAATAAQVRPLLPGADGCLVVVTSRSRLSGLNVHDGAHRVTLTTLDDADAVALLSAFTAHYRAGDDDGQLAELARLCARLPLALCVAAERAASHPHMELRELIRSLRDESALWDALSVGDEEEADAVRSVFAWSYRALSTQVARMFRLLGVHPGSEFGIHAAAALAGLDVPKTRQLLDALEAAHLIEHAGPDRYTFHDLLRAYAVDKAQAEESPEGRRAALGRVLSWYLNAADAAQDLLNPHEPHVPIDLSPDGVPPRPEFADDTEAMAWYEREHGNLLAAVHAAEDAGEDRAAWQLPAVLRSVHMILNPFHEWTEMSEIGLRAARRLSNRRAQAELLESLGMAYTQSHRLVEATAYHRDNLAVRRELGDHTGEAFALNDLGLLHLRQRHLEDARSHFTQSLARFRDLGEEHWAAVLTANLAETRYQQGALPDAEGLARRALNAHIAEDSPGSQGNALRLLSDIQRERGETQRALDHAEQAVRIARDHRNPMWEGYWLLSLARSQVAAGQGEEALASCQQAAGIQRRLVDRSREAQAWYEAAQAYSSLHRDAEAADFYRTAALTHRELGDTWQLALALSGLTAALVREGRVDQARPHQAEALRLIADYDDARADVLRERLAGLMGD